MLYSIQFIERLVLELIYHDVAYNCFTLYRQLDLSDDNPEFALKYFLFRAATRRTMEKNEKLLTKCFYSANVRPRQDCQN